jgi:hypothetical protein
VQASYASESEAYRTQRGLAAPLISARACFRIAAFTGAGTGWRDAAFSDMTVVRTSCSLLRHSAHAARCASHCRHVAEENSPSR